MKKILFACFALFLMAFAGLASAVVDLNTATAAELDALKGVGPAKAKAIIDYREKNGPFKSVDDLDKVKGFGIKTVEKLRPDITVDGSAAPAPVAAPATKPVAPAPIAAPKPVPVPTPKPTAPPVPAPAAPAAR
jgi:competence protein ComEA